MPKFKVTKTFTKKATIVKIIEADKAINAEINVALSIKDNDWKFGTKLESDTVKI